MRWAMLGMATAAALATPLFGSAEEGFDEFDKPTVAFNIPHIIGKRARICEKAPSLDEPEGGTCWTLTHSIKAKVGYVIHGIRQPQFYITWGDKDGRQHTGWVVRDDIE